MTHICANNNELCTFLEDLRPLRMLEVLELCHNKYEFLPNALADLQLLSVLKVAHNELESLNLPKGILTHCDLSGKK